MSPGALDPDVVLHHLVALDGAVARLRRHAGRPMSALVDDPDVAWAVERGLQLCAQNAIDVATHVAASCGEPADDDASAIDALGRIGVLPAEFARDFRRVAGFRNVLVHDYLEVDLHIVHEVPNQQLDDFARFARHVADWLRRDEGPTVGT